MSGATGEPEGGLSARLDAPPVFVVGAARSGTTWVFDAYRAHPLVAGVFESMLFARLHGLSGLLHPDHWSDERSGLAGLLGRDEVLATVRGLASDWLGRALQPHHRFLVEKTPAHGLVMDQIAEVFPDARFVNVVRDGRDVSVSRRAATRTWASTWTGGPARVQVARTARRWAREVRASRASARALGDRVLEVRYEQLHADPVGWYGRLYDFAGIPHDPDVVRATHERTDFALSGRADDATGFYRGGRVGDWRSGLDLADAVLFNAIAGDLLVELGYEENRRWAAPLRRAKPLASRD